MNFGLKIIPFAIAVLLFGSTVIAQIPVELFAGDKKATVDILFFRFFKTRQGQPSKFLFFNRNRASIDYKMTTSTNLPQFGFTEAFSYNHPTLKGFAPVVVISLLNKGAYPKAGIQYANIKKDYTIFSWLVCETLKNPSVDLFFLGRYTPRLSDKLSLFTQVEFVNAFPTATENNFTFTQRFRLGLKIKEFQFGIGADISAIGRNVCTNTTNIGGFLRYEF